MRQIEVSSISLGGLSEVSGLHQFEVFLGKSDRFRLFGGCSANTRLASIRQTSKNFKTHALPNN